MHPLLKVKPTNEEYLVKRIENYLSSQMAIRFKYDKIETSQSSKYEFSDDNETQLTKPISSEFLNFDDQQTVENEGTQEYEHKDDNPPFNKKLILISLLFMVLLLLIFLCVEYLSLRFF